MQTYLRLVLLLLAPVVAASIPSIGAAATDGAPAAHGSGGTNLASAGDTPYLVLVSIDGFRWDYLQAHPTPALVRLLASGTHAESMRPVYPTLTFPNHYSIATGLYPVEHGIVANDFADRRSGGWYHYKSSDIVQDSAWYGGEPVWVAAERAGLVTASYFFVGTEAAIDGIAPTHWRPFDASVPGEARVDQALAWLGEPERTRPHLVTLYFEHVDVASHRHGPGSPQSIEAIRTVDGFLARLLDGLEALPVADDTYVVIVSDHGQSRYLPDEPPLVLDEILDLDGVEAVDGGALTLLYLKAPDDALAIRDAVNARWRHGKAWLPDEMPPAWHMHAGPRIADVILQAEPGYGVISTAERAYKMTRGAHGWAPEFRDMHGIFIASGPGIPAGRTIRTIEAVDVYPLLLDILGLADRRPGDRDNGLLELLHAGSAGHQLYIVPSASRLTGR